MQAFLHGIILALGLILPLGVQNVFVFNQGVSQASMVRALPAVVTAAVCDTVLILVSVQGVALLLLQFEFLKTVLVSIGVLFLLYVGWLTWHAGIQTAGEAERLSGRQQTVFAMTVSLLNPHAILDTIGVIGTSSVSYVGSDRVLFTAACILVSWIWFFLLAALGRIAGSQGQFAKGRGYLNKLSAVFMWLSALVMLRENFGQ